MNHLLIFIKQWIDEALKFCVAYSRLLKISILYLLMFTGGLWHILDKFQEAMQALTSPIIMTLGLFLFWERWRVEAKQRAELILWSLWVLIGSCFAEWIGIKTGSIFGNYTYGETLYPIINQVPIPIGFAWWVLLFSSFAVVRRCLGKHVPKNILWLSLSVSTTMVFFDVLMEPAAVKLSYWRWDSGRIPIQNYLAWFIISCIFSTCAISLKLFQKKTSKTIAVHAYFAQLIYFAMVIFGK